MRNSIRYVLVSAVLASVVACGEDKPAQDPSTLTPPPPPPMPESRPATVDARPVESALGGGTNAGTDTSTSTKEPARPAEKPLTDGEIFAVTSAANNGEIEMAQFASKAASNPDVKDFAAMTVTRHRDMETKGKSLAAKAKITPSDNEAAKSLKSDVDSSLASMKAQKGKDFDKAYIDAQVKAHRDVLDMIDKKLLPSVQNGELRAMLNDARSHLATHLAKAEELQQKLEATPTTPPKATKPAPKK
jgi:putative membrane protein